MVIDKNNMHDFDTSLFFRFLFKACIAVMLLSKTFDIVMAVFDVGSHMVTQAAASISGSTSLDVQATLNSMFNSQIENMEIGELVGLGLETMVISLCMKIMSVLITVILYRDKLSERACRPCVSGVFYHGMCGDLCGAGSQCRGRGKPAQCLMVGCGIYRYPLFQLI